MNNATYIEILNRALLSDHGVRITYPDQSTAVRVRSKLYKIRDEIRYEGRRQSRPLPALRYNDKGRLLDLVQLPTNEPKPTPYDDLRIRVRGPEVFIIRKEADEPEDELPDGQVRDLEPDAIGELT